MATSTLTIHVPDAFEDVLAPLDGYLLLDVVLLRDVIREGVHEIATALRNAADRLEDIYEKAGDPDTTALRDAAQRLQDDAWRSRLEQIAQALDRLTPPRPRQEVA
jgi:hypothetical protein